MNRLRRRRIIILIPEFEITDQSLWERPLKDAAILGPYYCAFKTDTRIVGVMQDFETGNIKLCVCHEELPVVTEGMAPPYYSVKQVQIKYPYLFRGSTTDPILYRDFNDIRRGLAGAEPWNTSSTCWSMSN